MVPPLPEQKIICCRCIISYFTVIILKYINFQYLYIKKMKYCTKPLLRKNFSREALFRGGLGYLIFLKKYR